MIDVSPKFNTLRYAMAEGVLHGTPEIMEKIKNNEVPKGDVRQVSRAAGIQAAKRTAEWIVFCHSLPVDWVEIGFELGESTMTVRAEVRAVWKTGVEMEAMTAVSAALLNAYDMLKPFDEELSFGHIRLVKKKGGKSDFKDSFARPPRAAVLVISDSTFAGTRKDKSGKIIEGFLREKGLDVVVYDILPDEAARIRDRVQGLADEEDVDLILTTGGTGFGPRDHTPEAVKPLLEKESPGIVEALRKHGKERTPYAMLSREVAGIRGRSVIITLPGSSRGALESLQALFPGLPHAFPMLWGGGHDEEKRWLKPERK